VCLFRQGPLLHKLRLPCGGIVVWEVPQCHTWRAASVCLVIQDKIQANGNTTARGGGSTINSGLPTEGDGLHGVGAKVSSNEVRLSDTMHIGTSGEESENDKEEQQR